MLDGKIRIRTGVRVDDTFRPLPAAGGAGIDLTVTAPRNVNLRAKTWAGNLDVSGFRAGAQLSSRGGEVHAWDIDGEVHTNAAARQAAALGHPRQRRGRRRHRRRRARHHRRRGARGRAWSTGRSSRARIRTPLVRLFSTSGGVVLMGSTRPGARYEITALSGDVRWCCSARRSR